MSKICVLMWMVYVLCVLSVNVCACVLICGTFGRTCVSEEICLKTSLERVFGIGCWNVWKDSTDMK